MVAVASAVSPADYEAFSQAAGIPYPRTTEERMRLAPLVLQWKREQAGEAEPAVTPVELGVGAGILGAAGTGAWMLWDAAYRKARQSGATPEQAQAAATQAAAEVAPTPPAGQAAPVSPADQAVPASAASSPPSVLDELAEKGIYPSPAPGIVDAQGAPINVAPVVDKDGNVVGYEKVSKAYPVNFQNNELVGNYDYTKYPESRLGTAIGYHNRNAEDPEAFAAYLATLPPGQREYEAKAMARLWNSEDRRLGRSPIALLPAGSLTDSLSEAKEGGSKALGYVPRDQRGRQGLREQAGSNALRALLTSMLPDGDSLSGELETFAVGDGQALVEVPTSKGRKALYPLNYVKNAEFKHAKNASQALRSGEARILSSPDDVYNVYADAMRMAQNWDASRSPRDLKALKQQLTSGDIDFKGFLAEAVAGELRSLKTAPDASGRERLARADALRRAERRLEEARARGTGEELAAAKAEVDAARAALSAVQGKQGGEPLVIAPANPLIRSYPSGAWSTVDVDAEAASVFYRDLVRGDDGVTREVLRPYIGRNKDGTPITVPDAAGRRPPIVGYDGETPVLYTGKIGGEAGRPIAATDLLYLPTDDVRPYGYKLERVKGAANAASAVPGAIPVLDEDGVDRWSAILVPDGRPAADMHPALPLEAIARNQMRREASRPVWADKDSGGAADTLMETRPGIEVEQLAIPRPVLDDAGALIEDPARPGLPLMEWTKALRVKPAYGVTRDDASDRVDYANIGGARVGVNETGFLAEPGSSAMVAGSQMLGWIDKNDRLPNLQEVVPIARDNNLDPDTVMRATLMLAERGQTPRAAAIAKTLRRGGVELPQHGGRKGKPEGIPLRTNQMLPSTGSMEQLVQGLADHAPMGELWLRDRLLEGRTDLVKAALNPRLQEWSQSPVVQAQRVAKDPETRLQETAMAVSAAVDDLAKLAQQRPEALAGMEPGTTSGFTPSAVLKGYTRRMLALRSLADGNGSSARYTLPADSVERLAYRAAQDYPDLPLEQAMRVALEERVATGATTGEALLGLENETARVANLDPDDPGRKADQLAELLFSRDSGLAGLNLNSQRALAEANPSQALLGFGVRSRRGVPTGYPDAAKASIGRLQPSVGEVLSRLDEASPFPVDVSAVVESASPPVAFGVSEEALARMDGPDRTALQYKGVTPERAAAMEAQRLWDDRNSLLENMLSSLPRQKAGEPEDLKAARNSLLNERAWIQQPDNQRRVAEAVAFLNQGVERAPSADLGESAAYQRWLRNHAAPDLPQRDFEPVERFAGSRSYGPSWALARVDSGVGPTVRPGVGIVPAETIASMPLVTQEAEADNVPYEQRGLYAEPVEAGELRASEIADVAGDIRRHPAFGPIKAVHREVPAAPWQAERFGLVGLQDVAPTQGRSASSMRQYTPLGHVLRTDAPTEVITSQVGPTVGALLGAVRTGIPSGQAGTRFMDAATSVPRKGKPRGVSMDQWADQFRQAEGRYIDALTPFARMLRR